MNSIDVLKKLKNLNDLELISSNVIMKDGSTVEDSIGNLKDDLKYNSKERKKRYAKFI